MKLYAHIYFTKSNFRNWVMGCLQEVNLRGTNHFQSKNSYPMRNNNPIEKSDVSCMKKTGLIWPHSMGYNN